MLISKPQPCRLSLPRNLAVYLIVLACAFAEYAQAENLAADHWFVDAINTPAIATHERRKEAILIAIVDDGMRITHEELADFIWTNPNEKPGNGIDDDGNGFIDDVHGWDVSDHDNDVSIPDYRPDYYHGTHLASVVARIARAAYGDSAPEYIKLLPVKSIADDAATTYIKDGYKGIRYAIQAGADIIICSWGVGHIGPSESAILKEAADKGILVVAASGNIPQELDQFPAAFDSVLAIGSVERDGAKTHKSIYGQFVDIAAPGTDIHGAGIESDESYDTRSGTSFSTAMVAAAAALVKQQHPKLSATEVEACLLSSARPIALPSKEFSGKLGAGTLDVGAAISCQLFADDSPQSSQLFHSKGFLRATSKGSRTANWSIQPEGEISGLRFKPIRNRKQLSKGRIEFRAGPSSDSEIVASYALDAMPEDIFVPGTSAYVTLEMKGRRKNLDWLIRYEADAIDFKTLYCRDIRELRVEGSISDGSGPNPYSARSDCKWLITAPEGKVIRFQFDTLDTEPRTDMIYFFDGAKTNEQVMALLSGNELPPVFTTWRNQVLVWFVSDDGTQGQGWSATYTFEDP
ncbi:MAG: S8 family serine peptidase [Haliea sp.]|jgi:hypothetical protein|nr:S8 family serine peptidase [Haliea sp.]